MSSEFELSKEQTSFYEKTIQHCRSEIETIDATIAAEVKRLQELVEFLNVQKGNLLYMHSAACRVLNIDDDLAAVENPLEATGE